jgi:Tol biopolymer transport system component
VEFGESFRRSGVPERVRAEHPRNPLPAIPGILIRHGYGQDVTGILLAALLLAATHTAAAAENGPIAFGSDDALWRLDEGVQQRLPNGEGASWPAWSPDGSRIAFSSVRRDGIWVMNADGASLRRVTTSPTIDLQPTWSPDGRRLAFARTVPGYNTEVFVVGVDGKGLRRLTSNRGGDGDPDWAPNGKRIAWSFSASRAGARSGIYTMNPDASSKRFRGAGIAPDWSPDGRRLVFALRGDLWTEAVGGTDRRPLSVAPGSDARPEWSPDATQVAFLSSQGSPTDQYRCGASVPTARTGAC